MTSRLRTLLGCAALLLASAFGTAGVASAQSITLQGCQSLSGPVVNGNNITITCNTGGGGGPTAPSCGIPSLTIGTTLTFASTCNQGTNPITSVTAAGASQTPQNPSGTYTVTGIQIPTGNTTYTITACDANNLCGSNNAVYSVSGGGGGAMDLSGCAAAGYVGRGLDVAYPVAGNTSILNAASKAVPSGTFGSNDALVVRFTTPALGASDGQAVFQPAGNAPTQNTNRVYAVSTQPCQFPTSSVPTGAILSAASGQSPAINVNVGGTCPYTGLWISYCYSAAWLQPNTTYYITMVNSTTFGGVGSCNGNCDMRLDFNK